jgi:hypothetical protein
MMPISHESAWELLRRAVDPGDLEHFDRARVRSSELLEEARRVIDEVTREKPITKEISWVATGSVARLEATGESDLDLVAVYLRDSEKGQEISDLDKQVRRKLGERLEIKVSRGEELTSPTCVQALCAQTKIGGREDTVALLTKRILILTESRAITNPEIRQGAHQETLNAFADFVGTRGRHLLSLINDIARYYRTLMVDYKSRVDGEGKTWGLRNIKLRHSRKFWYVSTMLAMIYAATKFEHRPDAEEQLILDLFNLAPVERLIIALDGAGLLGQVRCIALYNKFLGEVSAAEVREALERVKHERRYDDEVFRRLKKNADEFHEALIEVLVSLPINWRRHLLGHFLL